jgi:hypothetical protein
MSAIFQPTFQKTDETLRNRLVLIGNGFDLSMNLKTRYSDFLLWLLKEDIKKALNSGPMINNKSGTKYAGYEKNSLYSISIKNKYRNINYDDKLSQIDNLPNLKLFIKNILETSISIQSELFKRIYIFIEDVTWVNIENIYYTLLKESIGSKIDIDSLNSDLIYISRKLEEYLIFTLQDSNLDYSSISDKISNIFFINIKKEELINPDLIEYDKQPSIVYFLNFNYTDTLSKILKTSFTSRKTTYRVNHIHGNLNNKNNPMIFGFGDEHDISYKEIEDKNDNRYFENIKSFKYLNTPNYHDLMRFIESDNYEVLIYGHSCGLSDRTMLKQIFENEKCKAIKIFYFKDGEYDDFENKTMEISRHFDDKGVMRKKIINKEFCKEITQLKS